MFCLRESIYLLSTLELEHLFSLQQNELEASRPILMSCLTAQKCWNLGTLARQEVSYGTQLIIFYIFIFKSHQILDQKLIVYVICYIHMINISEHNQLTQLATVDVTNMQKKNQSDLTPIKGDSDALEPNSKHENIRPNPIQQSQKMVQESPAAAECIDLQNDAQNTAFKVKRVKSTKERKIRTIITKEKLLLMNQIFTQYVNEKVKHSGQTWSLKKIATFLELGYSTILHKYREFRANKKVKAGALISSRQRKRKYKKSVLVEEHIKKALQQQEFFTASQMTAFIQQKYGTKFSRSIISRHLGQMGYSYKNVSQSIKTQNPNARYNATRKSYAELMLPLIQRNQTLIVVDQLSCCFNSGQNNEYNTVSILIACTIHGILFYHIQESFFSREQFYQIIKKFFTNLKASAFCSNIQGANKELYLVLDLNKIHRDDHLNKPGLAQLLVEQNIQLYYIPPCSPQLNPVEPIFEKIKERATAQISSLTSTNVKKAWQVLEAIMQEIQHEPTDLFFVQMHGELEKCLKTTSKK